MVSIGGDSVATWGHDLFRQKYQGIKKLKCDKGLFGRGGEI